MSDAEIKLIQDLIAGAVAKAVPEAVEPAIKKYVNGKIDRIDQKIDIHNRKHEKDMEEIKPFLRGISGVKTLGTFLKWVGGLAVAWFSIYQVLNLVK